LAARAPAFAELLDHDFMHRWAQHALAGDYWLNTGQAMIVGPGEQGQALHRDIVIWPIIQALGRSAPEVMVSMILALSEFTEDVGATRVVPGSHRWADFERPATPDQAVAAVMPAGSALLYLGKTVHAAGANVTPDLWRHGLHMSFVLGWLTPEEASPLGVPWEIAQRFSPRVQRMLGFASPGPGLDAPPRNWLIDFVDVRHHLPHDG
jgi:ectoine hydroxylase-related dioxygenase (phytanoyl-CoA dioxygenase family)